MTKRNSPGDGVVEGSFRDPDGQVIQTGGRIFRVMSPGALGRMRRLEDCGLLAGLIEDGLLVPSRFVSAGDAGLDAGKFGDTVIEHDRIDPILYPYEFSFGMLRDGALLTLEILKRCLDAGFVLKDATAYNIQFHNGRMVFIDILSIDDLGDGEPWYAYAQFCREFLFPLMLTAYKGLPFQHRLQGARAGVAPADIAPMFGWRDNIKTGVFRHLKLQARMEKGFKDRDVALKSKFSDAGLGKALIVALADNLEKTIKALPDEGDATHWQDYAASNTYSAEDEARKDAFVRGALEALKPARVVDIGANTGHYSGIAAETAAAVYALDSDASSVDRIYRGVANEELPQGIVPAVVDITDPSPSLGWRLAERPSVLERLDPDAFLALALVHHIRITANLPFDRFFAFLADWAKQGIVEWVDKSDRMVERMLRNRPDVYDDYTWEIFEAAIKDHFRLEKTEAITPTRTLCVLKPK